MSLENSLFLPAISNATEKLALKPLLFGDWARMLRISSTPFIESKEVGPYYFANIIQYFLKINFTFRETICYQEVESLCMTFSSSLCKRGAMENWDGTCWKDTLESTSQGIRQFLFGVFNLEIYIQLLDFRYRYF